MDPAGTPATADDGDGDGDGAKNTGSTGSGSTGGGSEQEETGRRRAYSGLLDRPRHPAVRSALRLLPERLPEPVRLGEVARAAGHAPEWRGSTPGPTGDVPSRRALPQPGSTGRTGVGLHTVLPLPADLARVLDEASASGP